MELEGIVAGFGPVHGTTVPTWEILVYTTDAPAAGSPHGKAVRITTVEPEAEPKPAEGPKE